MRCKWFFRNEIPLTSNAISTFKPKSTWKPPKGQPCLEMFLMKVEKEFLSYLPGKPHSYNLTKEEWKAMRGLAEDRSIVIKPADKGSFVVV